MNGAHNHYLESIPFYCDHIREEDHLDVVGMIPVKESGANVVKYVKSDAFIDEKTGMARTYIVRDSLDDMFVGFYSLKACFLAHGSFIEGEFDAEPGVELANFAVDKRYLEAHKEAIGIGKIIFQRFVLPTVKAGAEHIGASTLYIFALPDERLINRYRTYGFERLSSMQEMSMHRRIRPAYDQGCIFMYQKI